jgi:hypothetical protein
LRIKIKNAERLFNLKRKADICRGREIQSMGLKLESIEQIGKGETIFISVSNPNSLYIVDNFIVTHNYDVGSSVCLI